MTPSVAFKDLERRVFNMHCFTLLFTRQGHRSDQDDKIVVTTHPDSSDMFQVTYSTPELRNAKKFVASFTAVLDYANDILTSMKHDTDPFECIQVGTSIHPLVLYHVADMDDFATRDIVMNMLRDSLRFSVRLVPR
jgi:hypothetical protein